MAVTGTRVIRMTETLDVYDSGQKRLRVKGVRLNAPADSTAVLRLNDANGEIVFSLLAPAKSSDECDMGYLVDAGKLHLTLTGAAAEVLIYLE